MNIWDTIRDTCLSENDQDKRFNELSDETKELVCKLYRLNKEDLEDDVLNEFGIIAVKDKIDLLVMLFGEKNLKWG